MPHIFRWFLGKLQQKSTKSAFFSSIFRGLYNSEEGARVLRNKNFGEYGVVGPIKIFWGMCTPQAHCIIFLRKKLVKKVQFYFFHKIHAREHLQ